MSFLEQNKPNPMLKSLIIIVAVLLVVGGIYALGGAKNLGQNTTSNNSNKGQINTAADVEKIIAKWVEDNPQVIIESLTNMQRKVREEQNKAALANITKRRADLESDESPAIAPQGYDVTIVEFFDYSCGFCKKVQATVKALAKEDKKVRIIFKEYPILGQASLEMSKVAVAVHLLDSQRYIEFHDRLMESKQRGKAAALAVAKDIGIDVAALEETLSSKETEITRILQQNSELGISIGISGTPAFVIGDELLPGAVDLGTLKRKIAALRK